MTTEERELATVNSDAHWRVVSNGQGGYRAQYRVYPDGQWVELHSTIFPSAGEAYDLIQRVREKTRQELAMKGHWHPVDLTLPEIPAPDPSPVYVSHQPVSVLWVEELIRSCKQPEPCLSDESWTIDVRIFTAQDLFTSETMCLARQHDTEFISATTSEKIEYYRASGCFAVGQTPRGMVDQAKRRMRGQP